jgi:hypothetical protein
MRGVPRCHEFRDARARLAASWSSRLATTRRSRSRARRRMERVSIRLFALTVVIVLGLVVFSLTTRQNQFGKGCVAFNYTTVIGGSVKSTCGNAAKILCATPRSRAGQALRPRLDSQQC